MHFFGTVEFNAVPHAVWELLMQPDIMGRCLPGVNNWRIVTPNKVFDLMFQWPTNQTSEIELPVRLEWTERREMIYLAIKATTQIGSQLIHGVGDFTLNITHPQKTEVSFTIDITTPNKMFDRLVHTAVPKLANAFFTCLRTHLEKEKS
jgi:carbon monoxide dehydrogenase subunit G